MTTKRRAVMAWVVILGLVTVAMPGSTTDAQDVSTAPSAGAEFSATLSAVQTQHRATALNLKYDFPNEYCKNGLSTYSVDQTMTFTAAPVAVEVATVDSPVPGWGSQDAFLFAQGGSVEDVLLSPPSEYLMFALPQFEIPGSLEVTRSNARPAVGDQPEPVPYDTTCAGGDGAVVSTPEPSDCGERTVEATMGVIPRAPGQILAWATEVDPSADDIYLNCFPRLDMALGQFVGAEDGVTTITIDGGDLPTATAFLDPSVPQLSVTGSAEGLYDADGSLTATHAEWTLTLCRMVAGTPAC